MASIANDKAMIDELMYGEKDLHTLTAKLVFDYIPKEMTAKEVKEKFHSERAKAKGYEFAFNYNGNADTIKRNSNNNSEYLGITTDVTHSILNNESSMININF